MPALASGYPSSKQDLLGPTPPSSYASKWEVEGRKPTSLGKQDRQADSNLCFFGKICVGLLLQFISYVTPISRWARSWSM